MNTVKNLANANTNISNNEKPHGIDDAGISSVVMPKYANTNASAKYPTVSNANYVPYCASIDMLG